MVDLAEMCVPGGRAVKGHHVAALRVLSVLTEFIILTLLRASALVLNSSSLQQSRTATRPMSFQGQGHQAFGVVHFLRAQRPNARAGRPSNKTRF